MFVKAGIAKPVHLAEVRPARLTYDASLTYDHIDTKDEVSLKDAMCKIKSKKQSTNATYLS